MRKFVFFLLVYLFIGVSGLNAISPDEKINTILPVETYFENTEYELCIYKIKGAIPGNTMLTVGGIHGDEPGGYLAPTYLLNYRLKQGNLIIICRTNRKAISQDRRYINKDLNRLYKIPYSSPKKETYENKVAKMLKQVLKNKEINVMLNLHDGRGFCSQDPARWGQTINFDQESYIYEINETTQTYNLGKIARKAVKEVNDKMKQFGYPSLHHYVARNNNTDSPKTLHKEQCKSLTYYALKQCNIPAFGIETSKNLPTDELKMRYQIMCINAMMKQYGIIPYKFINPDKITFTQPVLKYIAINVNGKQEKIGAYKTLFLKKGDKIKITDVITNHKQGAISVNIPEIGYDNDFRKAILIKSKKAQLIRVEIKEDKYICGYIYIRIRRGKE